MALTLRPKSSDPNLNSDFNPKCEPFCEFYKKWLQDQERDLHELVIAAKAYTESTQSESELTRSINELVDRVIAHYENYYKVKSESAKGMIFQMLTPTWRSTLEDSFLWIGGWRPSMAFHLLYSKSGLQLEARFNELLSGLSSGDLGELSSSQVARIDELHMQTIKEEKKLAETLATLQETVADSSMVELSNVISESTRNPNSETRTESIQERVESNLLTKEEKLEKLLKKADNLRLTTLKNVLEILTPIQTVYFLISAAELHLRVDEWGKKKDERANEAQSQGHGPSS